MLPSSRTILFSTVTFVRTSLSPNFCFNLLRGKNIYVLSSEFISSQRYINKTADANGKTHSTPGATTRSRIGGLVLGGLVGSVYGILTTINGPAFCVGDDEGKIPKKSEVRERSLVTTASSEKSSYL